MLLKEALDPGQLAGRADAEEGYRRPASVDELTEQNIRTIGELDEAARAKRSRLDCIIDEITEFCGRMAFVWFHLAWFTIWICLNVLPVHLAALRHIKPFDPFPFQFLTLTVSLEAIFLSAFILISQNRQNHLSERRNHLDLQINLLSEQENSKMLHLLDLIAKKLEIESDDDPTIKVLEEATRPDKLVEQIEQQFESNGGANGHENPA